MGLNLRKQLALLSTSIMLIQVLLSSTGTVYAVQKALSSKHLKNYPTRDYWKKTIWVISVN